MAKGFVVTLSVSGYGALGLGFGVWDLGLRVLGSRDLGLRVLGSRDLGLRVSRAVGFWSRAESRVQGVSVWGGVVLGCCAALQWTQAQLH